MSTGSVTSFVEPRGKFFELYLAHEDKDENQLIQKITLDEATTKELIWQLQERMKSLKE